MDQKTKLKKIISKVVLLSLPLIMGTKIANALTINNPVVPYKQSLKPYLFLAEIVLPIGNFLIFFLFFPLYNYYKIIKVRISGKELIMKVAKHCITFSLGLTILEFIKGKYLMFYYNNEDLFYTGSQINYHMILLSSKNLLTFFSSSIIILLIITAIELGLAKLINTKSSYFIGLFFSLVILIIILSIVYYGELLSFFDEFIYFLITYKII
ncbi:MAG: hypothetical protein V1690_01710 [Candidatus Moraniibacteriota bacterium]